MAAAEAAVDLVAGLRRWYWVCGYWRVSDCVPDANNANTRAKGAGVVLKIELLPTYFFFCAARNSTMLIMSSVLRAR